MVCEFAIGTFRHAYCDCHKMLPYSDTDPIKTYWKSLPPKVWPTDSSKLSEHQELEEYYSEFKEAEAQSKKKVQAEQAIVEIATANKIAKLRFEDGSIYSVKFLKTPKEHFELRRDKL
jgi:hypothetical protein